MAINVFDFRSFIRSYIVGKLRRIRPNLDTSENSVVDDLYIKPMIEILDPLISQVNRIDFLRNLDNYAEISDADLDLLGENNYAISRNVGLAAVITIKLSFTKISSTDSTVIPSGAIFETSDNLKFQIKSKAEFLPEEATLNYNPSTLTYDFEVTAEAMAVGSKYNISAGQTLHSVTRFSNYLLSCTCIGIATAGTDRETNAGYADRIQKFYISQFTGSRVGYTQEIITNFPSVEDVVVIGYGDAEMARDLCTIVINGQNTDVHIGGKVDVYVKGVTYTNITETFPVYSPILKLGINGINTPTINAVTNITDITKTPTYTAPYSDDNNDWYIDLLNPAEGSYDPDIVSQIQVQYNTSEYEVFEVGVVKMNLQAPCNSIISVYSNDDETVILSANDYALEHYALDGTQILADINGDYPLNSEGVDTEIFLNTTQDLPVFRLTNTGTIVNGSAYSVVYSVNSTLNQIKDYFDTDENRIITTDILVCEAQPVYVNLQMSIKPFTGQTLDDTRKTLLYNSLVNFFDTLQLGDSVQESDIIGHLYTDATITSFVEYVQLPLATFSIPDDPTADVVTDVSHTSYIPISKNRYPLLNKVKILEITN